MRIKIIISLALLSMFFSAHNSMKKDLTIKNVQAMVKNFGDFLKKAQEKQQEIDNDLNSIDEALERATKRMRACMKTVNASLQN